MLYERMFFNHSLKAQSVEFQHRVALREYQNEARKDPKQRIWVLPFFAWIVHWF